MYICGNKISLVMDKNRIIESLTTVVHPEYKKNIVECGILHSIDVNEENVHIVLQMQRANDPFKRSLVRVIEQVVATNFPQSEGHISIVTKEPAPKKQVEKQSTIATDSIKNIIAVSSGKGGVGKSTVTANLAAALSRRGLKVGVLDADIYGPSMPKMFGVESYVPEVIKKDGRDIILPAEREGIKIMSIGFFIPGGNALVWRGPMATSALKQMIHDTAWGALDVMLIDMPPGTGDVHLSIVAEMKVTGAVVVSTPQQVALADVERGINMFRMDGVGVPVVGMIENMAWFTPAELPDNRYYIFGRGGCEKLAKQMDIPLLGQIPLVQGISESGDNGTLADVSRFDTIAELLEKALKK